MRLRRLSNLFLEKNGFSKLHTTKDITSVLYMTPHYVRFETFKGSRHSIVRLFLSNYISLHMVFLALDIIHVIFKKLLFLQGLLSSIHHHHSLNIFIWLLYFESESTNASVKIALIDIYHTCESLLCNHTILFIVHKLKNGGF
jgi:hypothetical protein